MSSIPSKLTPAPLPPQPATVPLRTASTPPSHPETALEKHVRFFDVNGDGVIEIPEVEQRVKELGLGGLGVFPVAALAAGGISAQTHSCPFTTRIDNIIEGKGTASTWIFDRNGNFDPKKLDEVFAQYSKGKGYINEEDLHQIVVDRAAPKTKERFRAELQFRFLIALAGEKRAGSNENILTKSRLAAFYSGELFSELAKHRHELLGAVKTGSGHDQGGASVGAITLRLGGPMVGPAASAQAAIDDVLVDHQASDRELMRTKGAFPVLGRIAAGTFTGAMKTVCPYMSGAASATPGLAASACP